MGREDVVDDVERVVVASVALTARALADVAPELTFVQWRVLVVVGDVGESISVGSIAAELGARIAATSRLVSRLRARGLLATAKDPADARVTLVRLTDPGRAVRTAVMQRRRSILVGSVPRGGFTAADGLAARRIAQSLEGAR